MTASVTRLLALLALAAFTLLATPQPAGCSWCIATFCGSSAECPGNCVCAIPWGSATGRCAGTR